MNNVTKEQELFRHMSEEATKPKPAKRHTPKPAVKAEPAMKPAKMGKGFQEVAGMEDLKRMVKEGFINVLKNRALAEEYGLKPPSMLLYGPAGCGKTFFAEKMAEEIGIPFIKVVPDDLACTWVHGTQQKIGKLFHEAEKKAPVLLFFDEFDAMVPHRTTDEGSQYLNGEVNEFLCMLNNASERGVYVLAATNHPERLDKAVLRTGRIDEMIYIDMPDNEARESLFRLALSKLPTTEDIDCARLAQLTDGYNCSDITYIVKTASRKMFNETLELCDQPCLKISQGTLEGIIAQRSPSVKQKDLREYERIRNEFAPQRERHNRVSIGFN